MVEASLAVGPRARPHLIAGAQNVVARHGGRRAKGAKCGHAVDHQPGREKNPGERGLVRQGNRDFVIAPAPVLDQHPGADHIGCLAVTVYMKRMELEIDCRLSNPKVDGDSVKVS